jgi:hypothetical protein
MRTYAHNARAATSFRADLALFAEEIDARVREMPVAQPLRRFGRASCAMLRHCATIPTRTRGLDGSSRELLSGIHRCDYIPTNELTLHFFDASTLPVAKFFDRDRWHLK